MTDDRVRLLTPVIAQHISGGSCDGACGNVCDCFGYNAKTAERTARAVLDLLDNGPDPAGLAGVQEIAQRAGVTRPLVSMWIVRYPEFPRPIRLRCGPIFWWPHVEAWLLSTNRMPPPAAEPTPTN